MVDFLVGHERASLKELESWMRYFTHFEGSLKKTCSLHIFFLVAGLLECAVYPGSSE